MNIHLLETLFKKFTLFALVLALPSIGYSQKSESSFGDLNKLSIAYPNPANTVVTLDYTVENGLMANIVLYSVLGTQVSNNRVTGSGKITIDVSNFPAGTYFYSLISDKGSSGVKRLAVVRY